MIVYLEVVNFSFVLKVFLQLHIFLKLLNIGVTDPTPLIYLLRYVNRGKKKYSEY